MFNSANLQPGQVIAQVSQCLVVIRNAMDVADNLYAWSSGVSLADLEGIGMSQADAQALQSAIADAHAISSLYNNGLPPGTYPQPSSAYAYGASQRLVIGPRPV